MCGRADGRSERRTDELMGSLTAWRVGKRTSGRSAGAISLQDGRPASGEFLLTGRPARPPAVRLVGRSAFIMNEQPVHVQPITAPLSQPARRPPGGFQITIGGASTLGGPSPVATAATAAAVTARSSCWLLLLAGRKLVDGGGGEE